MTRFGRNQHLERIMKIIKWIVCFCLRVVIRVLSWVHDRIKDGPQARLWLARDCDVLAEVKKRGLLKGKAKEEAPAELDRETRDAVKIVTQLQCVPEAVALKAVQRAKSEKPKAPVSDLITHALKYA